jgi:hypothetical protein
LIYLKQNLRSSIKNFGGVIFLIAGDVGQTLAKIKGRCSRSLIIQALFCRSSLFSDFKIFRLTKNLRLSLNKTPKRKKIFDAYEKFLLSIRNGTYNHDRLNRIKLPQYIKQFQDKDKLIEFVYNKNFHLLNDEDFACRAIVTPLNKNVDDLNEYILEEYVLGEEQTYFSKDSEDNVEIENEELKIPLEVLNKLNPSGLPKHELTLKKGAVVICLRNLSFGLANGTKLSVHEMYRNIIVLKILTGPKKNDFVQMPRITLSEKLKSEGTNLVRKQFPIKLAYTLTIDKSQGQSLKRVGVYLCSECFHMVSCIQLFQEQQILIHCVYT